MYKSLRHKVKNLEKEFSKLQDYINYLDFQLFSKWNPGVEKTPEGNKTVYFCGACKEWSNEKLKRCPKCFRIMKNGGEVKN